MVGERAKKSLRGNFGDNLSRIEEAVGTDADLNAKDEGDGSNH